MTNYTEELSMAFGYMRINEVKLLKEIVREIGLLAPIVVNIGAGVGTSSLAVREACPGAIIYTIDKSAGGPLGGLQNETNAFMNAKLRLPFQILGDSQDRSTEEKWLGMIADDAYICYPVNLLIIDGDHSYKGVMRDIEIWVPHVASGGFVAFHDYKNPVWPDVEKAVSDVANKYRLRLYDTADHLAIFKKYADPFSRNMTKGV